MGALVCCIGTEFNGKAAWLNIPIPKVIKHGIQTHVAMNGLDGITFAGL